MDDQKNRHAALQKIVRKELDDMMSVRALKKNGDTWPHWLLRIFTLDRILGAIAIIFLLGQKYQDHTAELASATSDIKMLLSDQMALRDEVKADLNDIRKLVEEDRARSEQAISIAARLGQTLESQIKATPTRGEVNKITDQIIRRLVRIENNQAPSSDR